MSTIAVVSAIVSGTMLWIFPSVTRDTHASMRAFAAGPCSVIDVTSASYHRRVCVKKLGKNGRPALAQPSAAGAIASTPSVRAIARHVLSAAPVAVMASANAALAGDRKTFESGAPRATSRKSARLNAGYVALRPVSAPAYAPD